MQLVIKLGANSADKASSITKMVTIITLVQVQRSLRKGVLNASLIIAQSANAEILS